MLVLAVASGGAPGHRSGGRSEGGKKKFNINAIANGAEAVPMSTVNGGDVGGGDANANKVDAGATAAVVLASGHCKLYVICMWISFCPT